MRIVFFGLLLINIVFFAWSQNADLSNAGHEPKRMQQLKPELIKLERDASLPPPPAPIAVSAAVSPAAATQSAAIAAPPVTKAPDPAPEAPVCTVFTGLSLDKAKQTQADIGKSAPQARVSLQALKEEASYWVHIPSQANKAAADKKMAELKQLGVADAFIMPDGGPNRFALSLGLFKIEDSAKLYLAELNKKGVRSARIEVRNKTDNVRLEITAPPSLMSSLTQKTAALADAQKSACKVQ